MHIQNRKEPIFDLMKPKLKPEKFEWQKRLVTLRPVPGLLCPGSIVVSMAACPAYHHIGRMRISERHQVVFQYTLSGRGVLEVDGSVHDLPPGRGFCCYVADDRITYYYPNDAEEPWRFLYVTFRDTLGITRALNEQLGFVFDLDPSEPQIKQLLGYKSIPELSVEISAGAGHLFANSIISMLTDQAHRLTRSQGAQIRLVRKAMQVIEDRVQEPFNAAMLADEVRVSQEHLNRIFRVELGQTPYQSICRSKMHRACEQLKNTNRTIAEIAIDLGYDPGSHFARLFRRIIGVTPSVFRRSASMPLRPF